MKLISDIVSQDVLTESVQTDNGNKWFISGVYAQAEKKNRNKRVYPLDVLDNQIKQYITEQVKTNKAIGELNHPKYPKPNPAKASHRITELTRNSCDYIGKSLVLNTPDGLVLQGLLEGGVQMGISSRGVGTVNESGEVNSDFRLFTFDAVSDPSGIDCWVNGIMEGVDYFWQDDVLIEQAADEARKEIEQMARINEEKLLSAFTNYMGKI